MTGALIQNPVSRPDSADSGINGEVYAPLQQIKVNKPSPPPSLPSTARPPNACQQSNNQSSYFFGDAPKTKEPPTANGQGIGDQKNGLVTSAAASSSSSPPSNQDASNNVVIGQQQKHQEKALKSDNTIGVRGQKEKDGSRTKGTTAKKRAGNSADPSFPRDIDLTHASDVPTEPPPLLNCSLTYDVPRGGKPRSCLTEKQLHLSQLYDHPRTHHVTKKFPPPPPPPRLSSSQKISGGSNGHSTNKTAKTKTNAPSNATEDNQSVVSEDISNTDDTSYLEHRELTPLLSSDTESVDVFDTTSLPGDPFPAGLPRTSKTTTKASASAASSSSSNSSSVSSISSSVASKAETNLPAAVAASSSCSIPVTTTSVISTMTSTIKAVQKSTSATTRRSYFVPPALFKSRLFPGGPTNKPLEPAAVGKVNSLVVGTDVRTLAAHLAKTDQDVLSIRLDRVYDDDLPDVKSGLHLLTLVDGWRLREDVMERCLCLRIFVLVTLFTATNWDQSVRTLAKWIRVAGLTRTAFGDDLGFFGVVSALCNPHLAGLKMLWKCLERDYEAEDAAFRTELLPAMRGLNELAEPSPDDAISVTVPHIIPFLSGCKDLKERRTFRAMFGEVFGAPEDNKSVDEHPLFQGHIAQVQKYLKTLGDFKENAESTLTAEDLKCESEADDASIVPDLFRTELHLRLLWGSTGCGAPADERHAKFEKVIAALAAICKNIERTLF